MLNILKGKQKESAFLITVANRIASLEKKLKEQHANAQKLQSKADTAKAKADQVRFDSRGSGFVTRVEQEASAIYNEAKQAFEQEKESIKGTEDRIRELRQFESVRPAHAALLEKIESLTAKLPTLQDRETRARALVSDLEAEVNELEDQYKQAMLKHGHDSAQARLEGKASAGSLDKVITLQTDAQTRKATLESAKTIAQLAEQERRDAQRDLLDSQNTVYYSERSLGDLERLEFEAEFHERLSRIAALTKERSITFDLYDWSA